MPEVTCKPSSSGTFIWTCGDDQERCKPSSEGKLFTFARKHGTTLEALVALTEPASGTQKVPFNITIRAESVRGGTEYPIETLSDFIDSFTKHSPDDVIEWYDDRWSVLDCDYHGTDPTMPMATLASLITPQPMAWWESKGGGLHALYMSMDGLFAAEWASAAAISAVEADPAMSKAEVLNRSRVPRAKVHRGCQQVTGALSVWCSGESSEYDHECVDEWLADQGMEMGGRYMHDHCPIAPDDKSRNPSVAVMSDGVKCFRCGFRSWGQLVGSEQGHLVSQMAKVWCWKSQALAILTDMYGGRIDPIDLARAYKALLKLIHSPDDPRVALATLSTEVFRVSGGNWVSKDLKLLTKEVFRDNYFKVMAGFKRYDDHGDDLPPDVEVRATYQGSAPISGIPELVHLRGAKIWGEFLEYPDLGHEVYRVQHKSRSAFPYKYVDTCRLSLDECEAQLTQWLPGLDIRYLKLCIAARGYAESVPAMPAMIMAYGNSGSGKTTTPRIAAAMCDDSAFAMSNVEDDGRWAEAFGEYSRTHGILILDESFKMAKPHVLRERLVALNRTFSYRALYVGPVTRELDNAIICTGITIPVELLESEQLGRRAVAIQLEQRELQWQRCNLSIEAWRDDAERAHVSDCLISHMTDQFFSTKMDFITQIAPALGVESLRDHAAKGEGINMKKILKQFVGLLMDQKASDRGRGWRHIDRMQGGPLNELWTDMLCDDQSAEGWARSEKLQEKPLGDLLGVDYPVYFAARRHGAKVFIRFTDTRETRGGRSAYKITDDIWEDMKEQVDL